MGMKGQALRGREGKHCGEERTSTVRMRGQALCGRKEREKGKSVFGIEMQDRM